MLLYQVSEILFIFDVVRRFLFDKIILRIHIIKTRDILTTEYHKLLTIIQDVRSAEVADRQTSSSKHLLPLAVLLNYCTVQQDDHKGWTDHTGDPIGTIVNGI